MLGLGEHELRQASEAARQHPRARWIVLIRPRSVLAITNFAPNSTSESSPSSSRSAGLARFGAKGEAADEAGASSGADSSTTLNFRSPSSSR